MMMVFLGVLSWFFSSSPQNRRVSFPSAKTCFDRVRGLFGEQGVPVCTNGALFRCSSPGCGRTHTDWRAPSWSGWSRAWCGGLAEQLCSTPRAGCRGMAAGIQGRRSCHITRSFPHSVRHQGGKTGQTHRCHCRKLGGIEAGWRITLWKKKMKSWHSPGHARFTALRCCLFWNSLLWLMGR